MAVKNFFSGVESNQHFNACMDAGAEHVLTSFLYLEKKGDFDIVKKRKQQFPKLKVLVDSGAHSFIEDAGKYTTWTIKDFEDYLDRYTTWLHKNKAYIFAAVEFDIDFALNFIFAKQNPNATFGTNKVAEWQKKYFEPLEKAGVEIIYVWHVERGLDGWEDMCSKHGYCGLPGEMSSNPDFNKYITVARRYTTKVHGFAATKLMDFRDWPWYSVDSITWKTSEMYGTIIHWDERKQILKFDTEKANRKYYRKNFQAHGLDADGIIRETPGSYKEVTKYALISMTGMEHFYARKYADTIFYYELRMPHPLVLQAGQTVPDSQLFELWKKLRPEELFKNHAQTQDPDDLREYLTAIACVQCGDAAAITASKSYQTFLGEYFPGLVFPSIQDIGLFQKEVAAYISPPNKRALRREASDYLPNSNWPKQRTDIYTIEDLEDDRTQVPILIEDIQYND